MAAETVWEDGGVWFRFSGVITLDELMASNNAILEDPRYDSIRYQILDFSEISDSALSAEDARVLGAIDSVSTLHNKRQRIAFILNPQVDASPFIDYLKEVENSPWELDVFFDQQSARQWGRQAP